MPQALGLALLMGALAASCGSPTEVEDGSSAETGKLPTATSCGSKVTPKAPQFDAAIDDYSPQWYQNEWQTSCDPSPKPGVVAFKNLVLATYPCTGDYGISRSPCPDLSTPEGQKKRSEHYEGRGWDWKLDYPHPAADALLAWLLATDEHGNKHAMARRLGIMYIVWGDKIWMAYAADQGWLPCAGTTYYCNPTTHFNHVHFSFTRAGAARQTSFWSPPPQPPAAPPTQQPPTQQPPTQQPPAGAHLSGELESAGCNGIKGWAHSAQAGQTALKVLLTFDKGKLSESTRAFTSGTYRSDLCAALGSCEHGFELEVPAEYLDGAPHSVHAFAIDPGTSQQVALAGSPRMLTCGTPAAPAPPPGDDGTLLPRPSRSAHEEIVGNACTISSRAAPGSESLLLLLLLLVLAHLLGRKRGAPAGVPQNGAQDQIDTSSPRSILSRSAVNSRSAPG